MIFSGNLIINNINLDYIHSKNGGFFKLERNSIFLIISDSNISNLNAISNNSPDIGFFLTTIGVDLDILFSNFTAFNNILKGSSLFYIEKNKRILNLINCSFISNTALRIFTIKLIYKLVFHIVSCMNNNNALLSPGTCFYFENILMQNFSKILIENTKSDIFASGIIFIDEKTLMNEFIGFSEDSYVNLKFERENLYLKKNLDYHHKFCFSKQH